MEMEYAVKTLLTNAITEKKLLSETTHRWQDPATVA